LRIPARNTPRRPSGDGAGAPRARRDQPLLKDAGAARHVRAADDFLDAGVVRAGLVKSP